MNQHALKIEDLSIDQKYADSIVEALHEFLTDLGYSKDRISELESRHRDGFSPYSHNKGGLEAVAFSGQESVRGSGGTGFKQADATLQKYFDFDVEHFETKFKVKYADWTEEQRDEFEEGRLSDTQASVLFSADLMLNSETELNVRLCVCVKDAPYHRQYDDKLEFDIEFKSLAGLKRQLKALLNKADVKQFGRNLMDAY